MPKRQKIVDVVRGELERRKMTPYELAKITGVSRSRLYNWVNGRSTLTLESVETVLDALGLEVRPMLELKTRPK